MPVVGPPFARAFTRDSTVERCPTGTFARAEQLIGLKRYRDAIAYCRQQLAESPRCVTLRLLLAKALLADGSGAAGVTQLEECLRIDPSSTTARKLLIELGVDVPMPIAEIVQKRRPPSIEPLPPPPAAPPPKRPMPVPRRASAAPVRVTEPPRRVTATPIAPSPRVVYSSPTMSSPLMSSPLMSSPLSPLPPRIDPVRAEPLPLPPVPAPVRIAHDSPAKPRKQHAPQRKKSFANPFVVVESKPSRAAARWERPLWIEARRPRSPMPRLFVAAFAVAGLIGLWRFGRNDAASLPTAAVAAASRPTPEPPVNKADTAPLDGVTGDIWIHPLAGPDRRMPVRDSRLFGAERVGDRPSECRGGHCGIDLAAAYGEPVFAVHDGVVERVQRGLNPDHGGRYVRLVHRDGAIATQYFHLSEIPRRIVEGARVKAGEVVGFAGLTGVKRSEPHLHFTIEVIDPVEHDGRYLESRAARRAVAAARLAQGRSRAAADGGAARPGARLHPPSSSPPRRRRRLTLSGRSRRTRRSRRRRGCRAARRTGAPCRRSAAPSTSSS